jgi:hypothetical protein
MEILRLDKPLIENLEYVSEYIDVSKYKRLRLNSYGDTILQFILEFTYDPKGLIETPLKISGRSPSDLWRSEIYDVVFRYVRIRILNQSGKINRSLIAILCGCGLIKRENDDILVNKEKNELKVEIKDEIREEAKNDKKIELEKLEKIEKTCSSPLRSSYVTTDERVKEKNHRNFFLKKKERPLSVGSLDPRLPGFISKNSILVGDKMGKITCLPAANIGDVLQIDSSGSPSWTMIYPPVILSDESKKKLKENKDSVHV